MNAMGLTGWQINDFLEDTVFFFIKAPDPAVGKSRMNNRNGETPVSCP